VETRRLSPYPLQAWIALNELCTSNMQMKNYPANRKKEIKYSGIHLFFTQSLYNLHYPFIYQAYTSAVIKTTLVKCSLKGERQNE
jgi:hypothetical protein